MSVCGGVLRGLGGGRGDVGAPLERPLGSSAASLAPPPFVVHTLLAFSLAIQITNLLRMRRVSEVTPLPLIAKRNRACSDNEGAGPTLPNFMSRAGFVLKGPFTGSDSRTVEATCQAT